MKIVLSLCFIFYSYIFAQYQQVRVGTIDKHYNITYEQVKQIIFDIENILEAQIGINLFDYDERGKAVEFVYMPPSQKKQNIEHSIKLLEKKLERLQKLQTKLINKRDTLLEKENKVVQRKRKLDVDINDLNEQIKQLNNNSSISKEEFSKKSEQLKNKQRKLKFKINRFNQLNRNYEVALNAYNQLVVGYEFQVKEYNKLQRELETLVRSSPEIQGAAKGYKQIVYSTFEKDGAFMTRKEEKIFMEKIEIYGFESLAHLRAILAHEILHLIGVGHTQSKGALMNPILQENQVQNLQLTQKDIENINKMF
jgi:hypothetical protein